MIWICNGLLICDAFPVLAAGGQERAVVRFLIREEQSGLLGKMKSMGLLPTAQCSEPRMDILWNHQPRPLLYGPAVKGERISILTHGFTASLPQMDSN